MDLHPDLEDLCTRLFASGVDAESLSAAGLADLMMPEAAGGYGGGPVAFWVVMRAAGRAGVPQALVEQVVLPRGADLPRIARLARMAGATEQAVRLTADHLSTRRQFGRALAEFQALRHRLVDVMIAAQEIHALGLHAALALEAGQADAALLDAASWKAGQNARHVAEETVQMHGGAGMARESRISQLFRDLTRLSLEEGGAATLLGRASCRDQRLLASPD